jgi:hypothetical protein
VVPISLPAPESMAREEDAVAGIRGAAMDTSTMLMDGGF